MKWCNRKSANLVFFLYLLVKMIFKEAQLTTQRLCIQRPTLQDLHSRRQVTY